LDWKDHVHQVGCIVTNLQALETVLRRFLMEVHGEPMRFPEAGDADADDTYLTGYLSLDRLVCRFNNSLEPTAPASKAPPGPGRRGQRQQHPVRRNVLFSLFQDASFVARGAVTEND
jgi:hypothetical protein